MAQADPYNAELKGIGGWLILPFGGLIITAVVQLGRAIAYFRDTPTAAHRAAATLDIGMAAYAAYCLVRFLQERCEVPLLMSLWYGFCAVELMVFWIAYAGGYGWAVAHPVALYPFSLMVPLIASLAWLAYFQTSVRVKNTFVERAPPRKEPVGFGGWLLVPTAFIIVVAAVMIYAFVKNDTPAKMVFAAEHAHWFALVRNIGGTAFLGITIFTLVATFLRKRYARWLVLAQFGLWAVLGLISVIQSAPYRHGAALAGVLALATCIYMAISKRVKNTFIR